MRVDHIICTALVYNDVVKPSDAIIVLEGDYSHRIPCAADLFKKNLANLVVISGGVDDPKTGKIPSRDLKKALVSEGVPARRILLEETSLHTRGQAVEIMKLAARKKWRRIILVASHFHALRAFLTFLKAMQEAGLQLEIFNAPVRDLPWFIKVSEKSRAELLKEELQKIHTYKKHIVSFLNAIRYLKWREAL